MTLADVYRGNDGALYYVRENGNDVFWFGERQGGSENGSVPFANVFFGQWSGPEIRGRWADVPKGSTRSSGDLRLSVSDDEKTLTRSHGTGGFGGTSWNDVEAFTALFSRVSSRFRKAGFQGAGTDDLTGTWMCNDGGTYYVRQIGDDLFWFGERGEWSNVYHGTIAEHAVTGQWADVPKGRTRGIGTLTLQIENGHTITRTSRTGGFGGSRWERVESLAVDVSLDKVILHEPEDAWGDEPFLWTIFFKIDGDTITVEDFGNARATVVSTSGSHNNLTRRENLGGGTELDIPDHVGRFSTTLKTVRGLDPRSELARGVTTIGFIVIAWDEDGLSDGSIEAGRTAFVNTLQTNLDEAIGRLSEPNEDRLREQLDRATRSAIEGHGVDILEFVFGGGGDDMLGSEIRKFNYPELEGRSVIPLDLRFREDNAHYQVAGTIRVT